MCFIKNTWGSERTQGRLPGGMLRDVLGMGWRRERQQDGCFRQEGSTSKRVKMGLGVATQHPKADQEGQAVTTIIGQAGKGRRESLRPHYVRGSKNVSSLTRRRGDWQEHTRAPFTYVKGNDPNLPQAVLGADLRPEREIIGRGLFNN